MASAADLSAIASYAQKNNINPTALLGILKVESGLNPAIVGGANSSYVGIFQLNSAYVADFSQKAGLGSLTVDQYAQLSVSDQLKVYDAYVKTAVGNPSNFFTGDLSSDTSKLWAVQLAPGNAKNIDYNDPNAVISATAQATVIAAGPNSVTVGSAVGSTTSLLDANNTANQSLLAQFSAAGVTVETAVATPVTSTGTGTLPTSQQIVNTPTGEQIVTTNDANGGTSVTVTDPATGNTTTNTVIGQTGTIKKPVPTALVPNPLHQFASYTYNWSLWWVDFAEYNKLAGTTDIGPAQAWDFGPKSFVVAEDSGKYPNRRLPGSLGLDYNISSVELTTVITPNSLSQGSNIISGEMTILEPHGATFLDQLIAASFNGTEFTNYTQNPFILQLEFTGYDDAGTPIANSTSNLYKKRFPIQMIGMKINVSQRGTEYKIKFAKMSHQVHSREFGTTPKQITVNGVKTVGDFFTKFADDINAFLAAQKTTRQVEFADSIRFDIEPFIATSPIVLSKEVPVTDSDPTSKNININGSTITIPNGTNMGSVITRIMAHSQYLLTQVQTNSQTTPFNAFRVNSKVIFLGDGGASPSTSAPSGTRTNTDHYRNQPPKQYLISIRQYTTFKSEHPDLPSGADSSPYTVKKYDYLYTGRNVDITDLKLDFDMAWYQPVNGYKYRNPAMQVSQSTSTFKVLDLFPSINLTPSFLSTLIPQLRSVSNLMPFRYKPGLPDANNNQAFGTSKSPETQRMIEMLRQGVFTSSGSNMLKVTLNIIGDPTFLKQDDWYYIPSPSSNGNYDNAISQAQFVAKWGHLRTDSEDIVVNLNINGVSDIDTDITNQGLSYPPIGSTPSLFSGQYHIIQIQNIFSKGVFKQVLTLQRYFNSDLTQAFKSIQSNQRIPTVTVTQESASNPQPTVSSPPEVIVNGTPVTTTATSSVPSPEATVAGNTPPPAAGTNPPLADNSVPVVAGRVINSVNNLLRPIGVQLDPNAIGATFGTNIVDPRRITPPNIPN